MKQSKSRAAEPILIPECSEPCKEASEWGLVHGEFSNGSSVSAKIGFNETNLHGQPASFDNTSSCLVFMNR